MFRAQPVVSSALTQVLIRGGTGDNEVINGVYFKLMHTFGVKAFKMVKQPGFYSSPVVRRPHSESC